MSARSELLDVRRLLRRCIIRQKTIGVRLAARWAFDLPKFGDGPVERIAVSLILAAVFGFTTFGLSHLMVMETKERFLFGGVAFATVLLTSAVLVLWGRDDDELAKRKLELEAQSLWLRQCKAELEDMISVQEADARYQEERETEWRERNKPKTKRCDYCREVISIRALKCPRCNEYLDAQLAEERKPQTWNPGIAAVLSFVIPGLGQIYKGQVVGGLAWIAAVYGTYILSGLLMCCGGLGLLGLPIGMILHVICLFDAASGSKR